MTDSGYSRTDDKPPPAGITVARIYERPPAERPQGGTLDDVLAWLVGPARRIRRTIKLIDELAWRLVAASIRLGRLYLSVRTLHPQFIGFGCLWQRATERTEERLLPHEVRQTGAYLDSPLRAVFEQAETIRRRLVGPEARLDYPVLAEFRAAGLTDYLALPMTFSNGRIAALTVASDQPGGFTADEIAAVERLVPLLAMLVEIQAVRRVARNILDIYLGRETGGRVLQGEIIRGKGEAIRAIIWLSDLRNFTRMSDHLPGERVIAILNACFERIVAPIHAHGGEVLKFMGDGVLAIFPLTDAGLAPDAAGRALDAAASAFAEVEALNRSPIVAGEAPLEIAVSLHVGEVIYGNIGAPDRLDFTAIGPAVNLASRLDQLAKRLERRLLVTSDFAAICPRQLVSLGTHSLRGLAEPHEVFTVPDEPAGG